MKVPDHAYRLSHRLTRPMRWWAPLSFLAFAGFLILAPAELDGEAWELIVILGLLGAYAVYRWNRAWTSAEVWVEGELTWIRTGDGLYPFQLAELKKVRINRREPDEAAIVLSRLDWKDWITGPIPGRAVIEFEDETVIGRRVEFDMRAFHGFGNSRSREELRAWMSAVNRRNSPLQA